MGRFVDLNGILKINIRTMRTRSALPAVYYNNNNNSSDLRARSSRTSYTCTRITHIALLCCPWYIPYDTIRVVIIGIRPVTCSVHVRFCVRLPPIHTYIRTYHLPPTPPRFQPPIIRSLYSGPERLTPHCCTRILLLLLCGAPRRGWTSSLAVAGAPVTPAAR